MVLWCSRKDELVWEQLCRWLNATEAPLSPSSSRHILPQPPPFQASSPPALPSIPLLVSIPAISNRPFPSWPSRAASHLPLCLDVHSKCTSPGWVAASYSMWEWSQLGHSLMNHFLQDTVRKSLSEFGVSNWCNMKLICPLLFVVEPGTVCIHMCIQPVTHAHKPAQRGADVVCLYFTGSYLGSMKPQTWLKWF